MYSKVFSFIDNIETVRKALNDYPQYVSDKLMSVYKILSVQKQKNMWMLNLPINSLISSYLIFEDDIPFNITLLTNEKYRRE